MGRQVAGRFRLRQEGRLSTPVAAAVLDGDTVIVEILPGYLRYYVVPGVTGFSALSVTGAVGESAGGNVFWWEFIGMGVGVLAGTAAAFLLQRRKQDADIDRIRSGDRGISNDIVVKKGKVNSIGVEGEAKKTLSIVTPDHDLELIGSADEIERVYETLA